MSPRRVWVGLLLSAVVGACNGSGGPIPLAELHDDALSAGCHLEVLCGQMPDQATCLAANQERPHLYASLPRLVAQGHILYDGAKARSCLDHLNALTTCARHVVADAFAGCGDVLLGQVASGDACFFSEECQNHGTCLGAPDCDPFAQCCAGTCTAGRTDVPVGGDCSAATSVCGGGAACVTSADGQATCQMAPSAVGASCASSQCSGGLYCDPSTSTCKAPAPEGGACNPALNDLDCDDLRDVCDGSGHCAPRLGVRAACAGAGRPCVRWATCDGTTSTCAALPKVGETCDPSVVGPGCLGGATCDAVTSLCTLTPTGGACL